MSQNMATWCVMVVKRGVNKDQSNSDLNLVVENDARFDGKWAEIRR